MWETWVQSLGREDLLEKEMAAHSSILAWKIPWMEKPGWLFMNYCSWGHKESDTTERLLYLSVYNGFLGGLVVKNLPAMQELQETSVQFLGQEYTLEKDYQLTPVFLPGEPHGQWSLVAYSP